MVKLANKITGYFRKTGGERREPSSPAKTGFTEKRLSPKRRVEFVRHFAFRFNDDQIQMVMVRHLGPKRTAVASCTVRIPDDLSQAADRQSFVADQIRTFTSRWGKTSRRVSLVLGGRETAFRSFLMPQMKGKDLRHAIAFEARKQLPFPSESCRLGYRVTSRLLRDDGPDRLRIAMHAATSDYVAAQLEPFRMAGVEVQEVCHTPDAIGLLLRELPGKTKTRGCTVIDVDRQACRISFYRNATLEFSLTSSVGVSPLGEYPDEIRLESFADSLIQEIQTSQDYYLGQFGQGLSSQVYLCGDTSSVESLCRLLDGRSSLHFAPFPVHDLPFNGVDQSQHTDLLSVLPVIGAAGSAYRGINLLPPVDQRKLREQRIASWVRAAAVVFGLGLIAGWGTLEYRSGLIADQADASERRLARLKGSEVYRTYHALKRQITADQAYLDMARKEPTAFHLGLKDLSRIIPANVTLTSMQFLPGEPEQSLTMAGRVESSDVPPEVILAEFIADLNASPFFSDVTVMRHNKNRTDEGFRVDFSISMRGVVS
jgi:Tfp pilus assembly PilM family ATPase/Tfp pilus assembly protein PilN